MTEPDDLAVPRITKRQIANIVPAARLDGDHVMLADKAHRRFQAVERDLAQLRPQFPRQLVVQPHAQPKPSAPCDEPKRSLEPLHGCTEWRDATARLRRAARLCRQRRRVHMSKS